MDINILSYGAHMGILSLSFDHKFPFPHPLYYTY